ncbi:MAG: hypothetical protein ACYDAE_07130, partial [Steroidobacteraceae bacterium]
ASWRTLASLAASRLAYSPSGITASFYSRLRRRRPSGDHPLVIEATFAREFSIMKNPFRLPVVWKSGAAIRAAIRCE